MHRSVVAVLVVVLGDLSNRVSQVPPELWLEVLEEWVPRRFIDVNRRAFQMGRTTDS